MNNRATAGSQSRRRRALHTYACTFDSSRVACSCISLLRGRERSTDAAIYMMHRAHTRVGSLNFASERVRQRERGRGSHTRGRVCEFSAWRALSLSLLSRPLSSDEFRASSPPGMNHSLNFHYVSEIGRPDFAREACENEGFWNWENVPLPSIAWYFDSR